MRFVRIECTRCPYESRSIKGTAQHLRDTNHRLAEVKVGKKTILELERR